MRLQFPLHALLLASLSFTLLVAPGRADEAASVPAEQSSRSMLDVGAPLSLKLHDLDATWKRLTLVASNGLAAASGLTYSMNESLYFIGATGPNVLYTQGHTTTVGSETFLVAYRVQLSAKEWHDLSDVRELGLKLPGDAPLALCLLNVRNVGSLNDIAPFDPGVIQTPEDETRINAAAANVASNSNLKQLGLAIMEYQQDYDEKFPPMQNAAVKQAIAPYLGRNASALVLHPVTKEPYQPNASLSQRSLAEMDRPAETAEMWEAHPAPDGTRGVLYVDGHVKRVQESDWPALQKASMLPPRQKVMLVSGAAALYFLYKQHRKSQLAAGPNGKYFISKTTGRVYYRDLKAGKFQWVSPPIQAIEVRPDQLSRQELGELQRYQGFNGSTSGQVFGGYGSAYQPHYADAVPGIPLGP